MPLLKYTTEVPVAKSVQEIMAKLQAAGALAIMTEYDPATKDVTAISFRIKTANGVLPFRLPADVRHAEAVLHQQWQRSLVPKAAIAPGQPARVVWRILKDWLDSQLALIEIGAATLDQVLLPYTTIGPKSLYQILSEQGYLNDGGQRLLGAGKGEAA